jgi:hypothetical protein
MAQTDTEATAADRTVVYLGNRNTVVVQPDGEREPYPGKRCTTIRLRADASLLDAITEIAAAWRHMSDDDAPAWVAADGPLADTVVSLLEAQYPGIEVREPDPADENLPPDGDA